MFIQRLATACVLTAFLGTSVVPASVLASARCEDAFKSKEEVYAEIDLMTTVENSRDFWQAFAGQSERQADIKANRSFLLLQFHLLTGDSGLAVNLYRKLFRSVELGIHKVREIENDLATKDLTDVERTAKAAERITLVREFGVNYGEYMRVRQYLENEITEAIAALKAALPDDAARAVAMEDPAFKAKVEAIPAYKTFKNLGVSNVRKLWPAAEIASDRVSGREVKEFFENTEAVMAMLRHGRSQERWAAARGFVFPFLQLARFFLHRVPLAYRETVTYALGLSYDMYLRDRYFPDVMRVMRIKDNVEAQLELFMSLNTKAEKDELAMVFARLISAQKTWTAMKEFAATQKDKNHLIDEFVKVMSDAETKARKAGPLSLFHQKSWSQKISKMTILVITAASGAYFTIAPGSVTSNPVVDEKGWKADWEKAYGQEAERKASEIVLPPKK